MKNIIKLSILTLLMLSIVGCQMTPKMKTYLKNTLIKRHDKSTKVYNPLAHKPIEIQEPELETIEGESEEGKPKFKYIFISSKGVPDTTRWESMGYRRVMNNKDNREQWIDRDDYIIAKNNYINEVKQWRYKKKREDALKEYAKTHDIKAERKIAEERARKHMDATRKANIKLVQDALNRIKKKNEAHKHDYAYTLRRYRGCVELAKDDYSLAEMMCQHILDEYSENNK